MGMTTDPSQYPDLEPGDEHRTLGEIMEDILDRDAGKGRAALEIALRWGRDGIRPTPEERAFVEAEQEESHRQVRRFLAACRARGLAPALGADDERRREEARDRLQERLTRERLAAEQAAQGSGPPSGEGEDTV